MKKEKLDILPLGPGVYKFLDKNEKILYIGKAINLRNRVKSYFSSDQCDRPRIKQMIPLIHDIKVIETDNEIESLVLESILIKKYKPYYNSDKKDDKSYAWIYISTKEKFPTVEVVRNISRNKLKKGLLFGPYPSKITTKRIFSYLRKMYPFCTCKKSESKECLYFHLGLCPGPHQGHISEEDYRKNINEIIKFLKGRKRGQIKSMEKEMKRYSRTKQYEKAATLRDRVNDLKYLGEKIDFSYDDTATTYAKRRKNTLRKSFLDLKTELGIKELKRIECYDISNIQGKEAYGSMVVAEDGALRRDEYRIFKIREMETPNDPAMLNQVLKRRFSTRNRRKYNSSPDIVLIDGGKSQLSIVKDSVPKNIYLLGISKGKRMKRIGKRSIDEFWFYANGYTTQIELENKSILIDLRDEAHRFATLHHRKARIRKSRETELDSVDGIGEKRKKELLKYFGDLNNIKNSNIEEINRVVRNKKVAENIFKHFNHPQGPEAAD